MILVLDYGLGNVRSIAAKYSQFGEEVCISSYIESIESADRFILPGVGSFSAGAYKLSALDIYEILKKRITNEKIPILGICLGMQLLTHNSDEGSGDGLRLIDGNTIHFRDNNDLILPHMGWNTVQQLIENPLLYSISDNSRFYFVHSYHVNCDNKTNVIATTSYGYNFPSIIAKDNIFGVQFHPEKSHSQGLQLLKNFARI